MLRNFINGLVDLIYPKVCLVCRNKLKGMPSIDGFVCLECWAKIKKNLPPFCHYCGRHLESSSLTKHICPRCVRQKLHFDRAFSPCIYEGAIKELIHQFKYRNRDYLGPTLSRLLLEFIWEYDLPMDSIDCIIPVPLHPARLREREFNQAQILSNQIARRFDKPVLHGVLRRKRNTMTQTELKDEERFLNVQDCFALTKKENIKNKNILLVDDVLTTGATSSEAARNLKAAGASIVFVLTLAN
jgi:ComF family protein